TAAPEFGFGHGVGVCVFAEGAAVPAEFLAEASGGDDAGEGDFGEWAAEGEVGAGFFAGADGVDPVLMVAFDAGEALGGLFVFAHFLFGEDSHPGCAVGAVHDAAFGAQDDGAGFGELAIGLHFGGARERFGAVVPD